MKKILATILALVLALGLTATVWAADVSGSTSTKAAKIGGAEYDTLQAAIDAASDGKNTVVILKDLTESITIASDKTITIDLNGHTLTNTDGQHTITNNGTLTIIGTGTVDNVSHARAALFNNEGATAVLNGGSFTRSQENGKTKEDSGNNSFYTIQNLGTMTINAGVSVTQNGCFSSMVANGYYNGTGKTNTPTMIINGGTFSGGINTVKNDEAGVLVINGGNFSNTAQYVIMNWHKTTINNGTFETLESAEAVLFTSNWGGDAGAATSAGELTITGGTFKRATNTQKMIVDAYDANNTGTASISGGTFDADVSQYLESGKQQNADGSVGNIPRYYYNSTTTTDTKKDDNKGTSPKTFDAGVGIYAVTAVLSVTGMAWTAKKRH